MLAGNVYGTADLAIKPAYLFQIVASQKRNTIYRTYLKHRPERDSSGKNTGSFKEMNIRVARQPAESLTTFEAIEQHFDRHSRLSARISLVQQANIAVEIEFPVKHLNLQRANKCFHVETGPILFPTTIHPGWATDESMPAFNPAFIHFNRLDLMEITLRVPTQAGLRKTRFLSETLKLSAKITLMAGADIQNGNLNDD